MQHQHHADHYDIRRLFYSLLQSRKGTSSFYLHCTMSCWDRMGGYRSDSSPSKAVCLIFLPRIQIQKCRNRSFLSFRRPDLPHILLRKNWNYGFYSKTSGWFRTFWTWCPHWIYVTEWPCFEEPAYWKLSILKANLSLLIDYVDAWRIHFFIREFSIDALKYVVCL